MNKNRDMFIDLVEEIDHRHLETHIKKNTDTRSKRIRRYIAAAGIYAAACVAVLLLVPVVINHTGNVPQNNTPGDNPIITEPAADNDEAIDEFFKDTKLYKVLATAGVDRKDVERLQVDRYQIVSGEVYYRYGNDIYRNTESKPIMSESSLFGEFRVCENNLFYTVFAYGNMSSIQKPLYYYNTETKEKNVICEDEILFFDFIDGKLVYVTDDSDGLKVYSHDPETEKSELMHAIPSEWEDISSVCFTGDKLVAVLHDSTASVLGRPYVKEYDVESKEWKGLWSISSEVRFAFADPNDGYYFSCEWTKFEGAVAPDEGVWKRHVDGVWYMNPDTNEKQKVTGVPYDELYFVNGKLVGVNGDEVSVVVENHDHEKYGNIEAGKVFPRPESMTISYGEQSYSFKENDPLYEYMYEKMNARVSDGNLAEVTGRECTEEYIYRDNNVIRVNFKYYYDSQGVPFYPDIENSDTAFALAELHFPITGDNTDVVFFTNRNQTTNNPDKMCFGTLTEDPEIEAKILEFFSNTVTE